MQAIFSECRHIQLSNIFKSPKNLFLYAKMNTLVLLFCIYNQYTNIKKKFITHCNVVFSRYKCLLMYLSATISPPEDTMKWRLV